ncbi:SitI3 family protein [Aneurinibacillus sp. REN35]|uniref:SitI3 family protein n=1 Tax=Aneurinibacillus sp. REN35 TaxID=3237286 RepID=UPI003528F58B
MFYIFYIGADCLFEELKKNIEDFIKANRLDNGSIGRNTSEEFVVVFDWATMSMKEGGQGLAFISEDYQMNLTYRLWFEVFHREANWAERFMTFIGHMLSSVEGDCVLESNGDTPILIRRNGNVVVDDKKMNGTQRFPFYALHYPFVEGDELEVDER